MTRWRILGLLFLARVGLGLQFQTVASVGDVLVVAFGMEYVGIGVLIGLFMAPGLVLALPAGYWGRYVSDRVMVVFGLGALASEGVVSAFATESWGVGLGRLFAGAGFLCSTLYLAKMVADWFDGREIATAMSVLVMSWPFGIAMGQVGHALFAQSYGWQVPFQVASAYCLIAAIDMLVFYRPPHDLPQATGALATGLTGQEWRLLLCASLAWAVVNAAYITYLSFGPKVLEGLGQSAIAAAGIISIGSWIMIASGPICGQIVDRLGGGRVVLTICMGGAITSRVLLSLPGAAVGASVLLGLIGMAPAGVIMAMAGQAMRPQVRAFGMGVFFTTYHALMLATPPLAGAILEATGKTQGPMWLGVTFFALVMPLGIAFQRLKDVAQVDAERKV